jgi:hypothetical protein
MGNDARYTREIKSSTTTAKAASNKTLFTSKLDLNLREKLVVLSLMYSIVWAIYNKNKEG